MRWLLKAKANGFDTSAYIEQVKSIRREQQAAPATPPPESNQPSGGGGVSFSYSPPSKARANCGVAEGTKKCRRCQAVWYCGVDCQAAHWKAGHKEECAACSKEGRG